MAAIGQPVAYYSPVPSQPNPNSNPDHHPYYQHHHEDQYYILVPLRPRRRFSKSILRCFLCFFSLIILSLIIFFLWPSNPTLKIVSLQLNHAQIHRSPSISLDISMDLTVKVFNKDIYSLDYKPIIVSIGYRGRQLGFVKTKKGHLKPWRSSYVDATLQLDGTEFLHDIFYLLEDLAKGSIPFDTVTEIKGKLGLFFFKVPIKAQVSCEVFVNTNNQTVVRQNCYPN